MRQCISTKSGPLECGSILTTNGAFSLVTGTYILSEAKNISPKLPLPTKKKNLDKINILNY